MAEIPENLDENMNIDTERPEGKLDVADRAIPGQSLTDYPQKQSWEQPAQLDTAEEALQFATAKLQEPDQMRKTLHLMKRGVALESMVKTLTFVMYKEGLITVDLQMMIQPYLFMFLMGIGREFGVTPVLFDNSKPEEMPIFDDLVKDMNPEKAEENIKDTTRLEEEVEPRKLPEEVQAFMQMQGEEIE
jgi:hypothetical protein|tara:strand:+ start:579 stop:1145 length:567 start_codon:yes stop_codon:yes gene_type:complete